jgi:hypothetical protein
MQPPGPAKGKQRNTLLGLQADRDLPAIRTQNPQEETQHGTSQAYCTRSSDFDIVDGTKMIVRFAAHSISRLVAFPRPGTWEGKMNSGFP